MGRSPSRTGSIPFPRTARLLTLVCFFHFSGLNNGITCMVESSGSLQSAGFAPVFIARSCAILNPVQWRSIFSRSGWSHAVSRSSRVIGCASQRAVQNMLADSFFTQVRLSGRAGSDLSRLAAASTRPMFSVRGDVVFNSASERLTADRVLSYMRSDYEPAWLKGRRFQFLRAGPSDGWKLGRAFAPQAALGLSQKAVVPGRRMEARDGRVCAREGLPRTRFGFNSRDGDVATAVLAKAES